MSALLGLIGLAAALAMIGGIAGVASATTIFQEIELAVSWGFMAVLWALDEIRKRLPEPPAGQTANDAMWTFLKWTFGLVGLVLVVWAITLAERRVTPTTIPQPPIVDQPR